MTLQLNWHLKGNGGTALGEEKPLVSSSAALLDATISAVSVPFCLKSPLSMAEFGAERRKANRKFRARKRLDVPEQPEGAQDDDQDAQRPSEDNVDTSQSRLEVRRTHHARAKRTRSSPRPSPRLPSHALYFVPIARQLREFILSLRF